MTADELFDAVILQYGKCRDFSMPWQDRLKAIMQEVVTPHLPLQQPAEYATDKHEAVLRQVDNLHDKLDLQDDRMNDIEAILSAFATALKSGGYAD